MRPSGDLIFGAIIRLVILYFAAIATLVYWPVGVGLLVLAILLPWHEGPDWVTPEPQEKEPEESETKKKEPFWLWDR